MTHLPNALFHSLSPSLSSSRSLSASFTTHTVAAHWKCRWKKEREREQKDQIYTSCSSPYIATWNESLGLWEMWFADLIERTHKSKQNINQICGSCCQGSAKHTNIVETVTFNNRGETVILGSFCFLSVKKSNATMDLDYCIFPVPCIWSSWCHFQQSHLKLTGFIGAHDLHRFSACQCYKLKKAVSLSFY